MMFKKIAIVTGVASGIGAKIAKELLNMNVIVYGIDICPCRLKGMIFHRADITDENSIAKIVETIYLKHKGIDYLINSAGIISVRKCYKITEVPLEEWNRVIDVNLKGTFILIKHCLCRMNRGGTIINFSTEQVKKPNLKSVPYAVSKVGIEMLNRVVALEARELKVRSNVIALGSVNTKFIYHMMKDEEEFERKINSADNTMPFGIITVEDVWKIVQFILFDALKMTGQTVLVDSGMTL